MLNQNTIIPQVASLDSVIIDQLDGWSSTDDVPTQVELMKIYGQGIKEYNGKVTMVAAAKEEDYFDFDFDLEVL